MFDQKKWKWADEMSRVILSHNTTESRATKFTPFRLLYGAEAMCPEELVNQSARVLAENSKESEELDKDFVESNRLNAVSNLRKYQEETKRWRDKKVIKKDIQVGDFILKRKKNPDSVGKLQISWEGPYIVPSSSRDGTFRLKDEEGNELPHSWNVDNLRKFYP
jgi:hypothetical protein